MFLGKKAFLTMSSFTVKKSKGLKKVVRGGGDNINNVENKTIQGGSGPWWAFENLKY